MQCTYLIVSPPHADRMHEAGKQLLQDVLAGYQIKQLFFYADAVVLGTLDDYPEAIISLLQTAEDHHIPTHLCSAAFQQRRYHLSDLGKQDFDFKGLGKFISESRDAEKLRVF